MRHLFTFFLLYLYTAFNLSAQNYYVNWGNITKTTGRDNYEAIISADSNDIVLLRSKRNTLNDYSFYLDYFNTNNFSKDLSAILVEPQSYKTLNLDSKTYFEYIQTFGTEKVMFFSSYQSGKNENTLYAQRIGELGTPSGDIHKISSIEATRKYNRGNFNFAPSPSEKFLAIQEVSPEGRINGEKFGFKVIDSTLSLYWRNEFTIPYPAQLFTPIELKTDNNANVYLLCKVYISKDDMAKKGFNAKSGQYYAMFFFHPNDDEGKFSETIFYVDDKIFENMTFRIGADNELLFTGFYSTPKNKSAASANGIYTFTIQDGIKFAEEYSFYDLGDFIPNFQQESLSNFNDENQPILELTDYILFKDGSSLLVAEHTLMTETCYTDYKTALSTCNYSFYFNDIFVIKLTSDGQIQWKIRIPKRQLTRNDNGFYSSFALGILNDKLVFLYNDNPKNKSLKDRQNPYFMKDPARSVVTLVEISLGGRVVKKEMFSNARRPTYFIPRLSYQYNTDNIILYAKRNKKNQFGLLLTN